MIVHLATAVRTVSLSYRLLSSSVMLTSLTFSLLQGRKRKKQNLVQAGSK